MKSSSTSKQLSSTASVGKEEDDYAALIYQESQLRKPAEEELQLGILSPL
jgi:hypothetical protein